MELVDLRYLSVVVETGSLSNAPQLLGINPSTIGRRIMRLEDELGVTIFERGPFGYRLTTAGRELWSPIRHVLDAADAVTFAGKSSGTAKTGRVRLGVRMPPIGTPLQSLLATWRNRHPTVALTLHELNDSEISIALADRALDVALVTAHSLSCQRSGNEPAM